MSGITVVVVPTWAIWIFVVLGVLNIAQHLWKLWLLRKIEQRETPNCCVHATATAPQAVPERDSATRR
jgi:biopolymer transport protein ExbB/TolQ